jgi:hypothetical protein
MTQPDKLPELIDISYECGSYAYMGRSVDNYKQALAERLNKIYGELFCLIPFDTKGSLQKNNMLWDLKHLIAELEKKQ